MQGWDVRRSLYSISEKSAYAGLVLLTTKRVVLWVTKFYPEIVGLCEQAWCIYKPRMLENDSGNINVAEKRDIKQLIYACSVADAWVWDTLGMSSPLR